MTRPRSSEEKKILFAHLRNVFLVLLGSLVIAAADAIFIVPFDLLPGGVASIGVIAQYFVTKSGSTFQIVDIVTWIVNIALFLVGVLAIGKRFALQTLLATISYPLFFTILYRTGFGGEITRALQGTSEPLLSLLLAGMFGGALIGVGVAFAFLGNGSTGGVDVICYILARVTPLKESVYSFLIDGSIIVTGIICMWDKENILLIGMIGIVAAILAAVMIQVFYISGGSYITVYIISERWEEIRDFVQKDLGRGSTVIDAVGGYTGDSKKLLYVAVNKFEANQIKTFIAHTDPRAFVTFSSTNAVNGEGFAPFEASKTRKNKSK